MKEAPLLHLLIELLKEGRAETIPELAPFEPIEIDTLLAELQKRTGVAHGKDANAWCTWYCEDYADASKHDRETLRLIQEMVEGRRFYGERLRSRAKNAQPKGPTDSGPEETC